ncbi:DUF2142 domain-containing protein [Microbacterium sp. TL13]|nr:DUF2142 domain-containing protein [Microbacterium sp. TL13]
MERGCGTPDKPSPWRSRASCRCGRQLILRRSPRPMRFPSAVRRLRPAAIIAAVLLALLAWAVSSPPGSSPDDDYHMASIWCATTAPTDLCSSTPQSEERTLHADVLDAASCFAFDSTAAASCPRDETGTRVSTRGNWNGEAYPPVYYATMHLFAGDDLSASIVLIRSVNALLYVGLIAVVFFLLPRSGRAPLIWGALITAVPLGAFLVASVNPSSWAVISATALWAATWGYFQQRGWRKAALAVLTVLLVVVGAGSRGDAAAYAMLALFVGAALSFRRDRRFALESLLPVALVLVSAALFLSAGQSAVVGGATVVKNQTYTFSELLFINVKQLPQLITGFTGTWGLGWLDTYMPGIVWVTTMLIFGGVVFWGLRVGSWRKWLVVAAVGAGVVAVPLFLLMHDGVVVGNGVQPRYGFPLVIMFAGVVLIGLRGASLGLGRAQLIVAGVGLIVANSVALHVNLRRYVTGLDRVGINLDRDIEWWWNAPISPMGVWVFGTLAFAAAIAVLLTVAWPPARERRSSDATGIAPVDA